MPWVYQVKDVSYQLLFCLSMLRPWIRSEWTSAWSRTWCQFHQRFTRAFFVRKSFRQLFSAYSLALNKLSYKKISRKMLMKLTPGIAEQLGELLGAVDDWIVDNLDGIKRIKKHEYWESCLLFWAINFLDFSKVLFT